MKYTKLIFLTVSSLIFNNAEAAETDKYYAKVNLGWAISPNNKVDIYEDGKTDTFKTRGSGSFVNGALGLGYKLNKNLRSDVELYMDDGIQGRKRYQHSLVNYKVKTRAVFFNGYYDYSNITSLTPFIMAGVGHATNHLDISTCHRSYKKSMNGIAWQVGAGIAYDVSNNISLELGYKFINKSMKRATLYTSKELQIASQKSSGKINAFFLGTRVKF